MTRPITQSRGLTRDPYLGQVATRCYVPNTMGSGTNRQWMSHSRHYARDDISAIRVLFPNFAALPLENDSAATITISASIEYPIGTIRAALTFGGSASGAAVQGADLLSDMVSLAMIPAGAMFAVNEYAVTTGNMPYGDVINLQMGEKVSLGTSVTNDVLNPGWSGLSNGGGVMRRPLAILGMTQRRSALILGDSRAYALGTDANDLSGDLGEIARSIGPRIAYINAARGALRAEQLATSYARRALLGQYVSDIICNLGINDAIATRTAAQTYADLQAIRGNFPKPFWLTTNAPKSSSSNGFIDAAGQTTDATANSRRVGLNALKRVCKRDGFAGWFELADPVETSRDSGLWSVVAGVPMVDTSDGLHQTLVGLTAQERAKPFGELFNQGLY